MSVNGLHIPLSGLTANQFRQDVAANNVANVNTDGFRASTVRTTDAAYVNDIGQGTRIAAAYAPARPAPAAAASAGLSDGARLSNTDLVVETTHRLEAHNAYGANAAMFRAVNDAGQALLDLKG